MFKAGVIASTTFLASSVQGVYTYGKCPKVEKDWQASNPGQHLDIKKMAGDWFGYQESYIKQMHSDCIKIKFKPVEGHETMLQKLTGVSFKRDDVVVYNDNKILNFNHPTDSSYASFHAVEEINGPINDIEIIEVLPSLNLPKLRGEKRAQIDIVDIDLYDKAREENRLLKDFILDGLKKGDRFTDPYEVLDTDYENFLVTYQCRQERRLSKATDYILAEGETYRQIVEEYDQGKGHDKDIANGLLINNAHDETLEQLQMQISEDDDTGNLSDADYNKEIDTVMELDAAHRLHFSKNRPTVEEWKERRHFYLGRGTHSKSMDHELRDETAEKWFNSVAISVYVRDPTYYENEERQAELKKTIRAKIPGYDFDSFHLETNHNPDYCISGDIFAHPNAHKLSEIDKLDRPHKWTEKDAGKQWREHEGEEYGAPHDEL